MAPKNAISLFEHVKVWMVLGVIRSIHDDKQM